MKTISNKGMTSQTLVVFVLVLIVLGLSFGFFPGMIKNLSATLIGASEDQVDKAIGQVEIKEDVIATQTTPIDDKPLLKPITGTCDNKVNPQNYQTYQSIIESAVKKKGKQGKSLEQALEGSDYDAKALLASLIQQESGGNWDKKALSPCASIGIAQFTAATAMTYDMKVAVMYNGKTQTFTSITNYRDFINNNNLWKECGSCGTKVSPCNKCTPEFCDYNNDDRFKPELAIPASATYLADQITLCKKAGKSIVYGVGAYNSGNCNGEANKGYTAAILEKWYPSWAACLQ
jgi:hypothetical protein